MINSILRKIFDLFKQSIDNNPSRLKKLEKILMKDKSFVKDLNDFNQHYEDVMKRRERIKKKYGDN